MNARRARQGSVRTSSGPFGSETSASTLLPHSTSSGLRCGSSAAHAVRNAARYLLAADPLTGVDVSAGRPAGAAEPAQPATRTRARATARTHKAYHHTIGVASRSSNEMPELRIFYEGM